MLRRQIAEVIATDVARGIARISKYDAALLGIDFGELLELKAESGATAYAKCFLIHPSDENRLTGMVQIDGPTRMILHADIQDLVAIIKAEAANLATSVTLEPMDGFLPETLDKKWLGAMIEDKPLWKDAILIVPVEGKPFRFQITSVEPANKPVSIGTMLTKIVLPSRENTTIRVGELFAFTLEIEFKRQVTDYDTLSEILRKKGFISKEWKMGGALIPEGTDPNLIRRPPGQGGRTFHQPQPSPNLKRGRIQVLSPPFQPFGRTLMIGHGYENNPFENPEGLLRDIEQGMPLIKEALEKDLKINLKDEIKAITFQCMYKVRALKDARVVIENAESLVGSQELMQLVGHRRRESIKLYPISNDRSLNPQGLMEISISPISGEAFNVQFFYGLPEIEAFSYYVRTNAQKSAAIIQGLEQNTRTD